MIFDFKLKFIELPVLIYDYIYYFYYKLNWFIYKNSFWVYPYIKKEKKKIKKLYIKSLNTT